MASVNSFLTYLHDAGKIYKSDSKKTISTLKNMYPEEFTAWSKTPSAYVKPGNEIKYKRLSIVDDKMAEALKRDKLLSISSVLEKISKVPNLDKIEVLDLSENNIGIEGANTVIEYILLHLPNLKALDLTCNMIEYKHETERFNSNVAKLFKFPNFKVLDIRGNAITNHRSEELFNDSKLFWKN
jgi:Ran GTPase-activating protein (RanGAP) involved in mRNA processing and transport